MHRRKRRILKSLVLGLAIAAFAAPTAQGEPRGPGNPIEAVPTQQSLSPDDRPFYRGSAGQVEKRIVSPDDRSFYRGEAPTQVVTRIVSPDDRPLYRGVEAPSVLPISVTVSSESDDFQWVDAGLGAASTLAFLLALGGAALMIRHQRRRIAAF